MQQAVETGSKKASPLADANEALRNGDPVGAIQAYLALIRKRHALSRVIGGNLATARREFHRQRSKQERLTVGVCGWELSHNAAGRVYTLAKLYEGFADVEILGTHFPSWGEDIWSPIRDTEIVKHSFVVERGGRFLDQALDLVAQRPCDLIHLSKPRASNILIGALYKLVWGSRIIVDIDDEELAFVNADEPLSLDAYLAEKGKLPALDKLHETDWTRLAVGLASAFDGVTVSNPALQVKYGGTLIRHARDETRFQQNPQLRQQSREQFGIAADRKVVLFFGTPRAHKGILETAQAIASLRRNDVLFVVVGDFPDEALERDLRAVEGLDLMLIGDQPIDDAPKILALADVCAPAVDARAPVAPWQLPAKIGDALAMGVPLIVSATPAVQDVVDAGAAYAVTPATMAERLGTLLDTASQSSTFADKAREHFIAEWSFQANRPRLRQATAAAGHNPISPAIRSLVKALDERTLSLLADNLPEWSGRSRRQTVAGADAIFGKVAVVAHVYYQDLWVDIAERLRNIGYPFELFVTTTDDRAQPVARLVKQYFPSARVVSSPNRGMDVLPYINLLPTLQAEGFLAVCKVHTKRGEGEAGQYWRQVMLDALIGDNDAFVDVVRAFAQESTLALAGPASHYQSAKRLMLDNTENIDSLLRSLDQGAVSESADWGFFAGSMFWARPEFFAPLAGILDKLNALAELEYATDGQLSHALERLLGGWAVSDKAIIGLLQVRRRADAPLKPCDSPIVPKPEVLSRTSESDPGPIRYMLHLANPAADIGQTWMGELAAQLASLEQDRERIVRSGLFDTQAYLSQVPALAGLGIDLPIHYLLIGRFKGLKPHRNFDPEFYAHQHAELLSPGEDPFCHYLNQGAVQGLLLRPTKEQELREIPNFRYRVLNTALIDWEELSQRSRAAELVSIIIPVLDNLDLTLTCIESIYEFTDHVRFETIVVDNGSQPHTGQTLDQLAARYPSLSVVHNEENLNFALGCNLGFAASRGKTVVFLNNDTRVTRGWLMPLVTALERPEISAVQPLLLYPNETIQCMGIVFSEHSPMGYPIYAGYQPEPDWAGRSRSFHAVTGACMALRADDFVAAKGFDAAFINGQEDIDLCLRLNQHSHHRCWYASESRVYHHESASAVRDRFIPLNKSLFAQRWCRLVQADDQGHYAEDDFHVIGYVADIPDATDRNTIVWRPKLKNLRHVVLERPDDLDPYFFDQIKASGLFDARWYYHEYNAAYDLNVNLLGHYLAHSLRENLNPSPAFDTRYYVEANPDLRGGELHPFVHYVVQGRQEGRQALPPPPPEYVSKYQVAEPKYVPRLPIDAEPVEKAVRVIAFYLPQFHAIPENDEWWGKGFTEWTNVRPAKPQFAGHYQPHVPDEFLGHYDLLDGKTQAKQVELAKQYGIEGFCFYLYWFTGHRLLEKPIDNYLRDSSLDLPFCVCWANENWSRRWDGRDQDLLMEQHYSAADDIAFITEAAKYLRDPRYIRVNGKPLLLVYRPNLFPEMRQTVSRWRDWCRDNDIGEIYLAYPQSFEAVNPAIYGFDAAVGFPPNNSKPPDITNKAIGCAPDFCGKVYDWRVFLDRSESFEASGYKFFRGLTPSWDNTARKKRNGTVFQNSCPSLFELWATRVFADTVARISNEDERLVFVNAWNEWAEGAHLEPDTKFGYAWLQSIRNAHEVACLESLRFPFVVESRWHKIEAILGQQVNRSKYGFLVDYDALLRQACADGCGFSVSNERIAVELKGDRFVIDSRRSMSRLLSNGSRRAAYCFVILQYNKSNLTVDCVESVRQLCGDGPDFHIIIVDNNSSLEHFISITEAYGTVDNVHILRAEENLGFSGGNNLGYRYARDELSASFVVVINNDTTILQANFIDKTLELFDEYAYSIAGPDVRIPDGRQENPWNDYIYSIEELKQLRQLRQSEYDDYISGLPARFKKIGTASPSSLMTLNPLLQGAAFVVSPIFLRDHVDLFDERLFLYGEEFLLSTELVLSGHLSLYTSEISVNHSEGASTSSLDESRKLKLGYESALYALDLALLRLERKRDASRGVCIPVSELPVIRDCIRAGGMHVLIDLFFCQPGYHGGGEYGKAVFKQLAAAYARHGGFEVWVAMSANLFIDQWVWDTCRDYGINVVNVSSYDDIVSLVNDDCFDAFFTPAIVVYTGYEYMTKVGGKLPFKCKHTRVVGTLHDIRDFELASSYSSILDARRALGCIKEASLDEAATAELLESKVAEASALREMYRNIISDEYVSSLVTISEYCRNSILTNVGLPRASFDVLMSPMKPRPAPDAQGLCTLGCDDVPFALMMHAARIEKNAVTAVVAFDRIFSEKLVPEDFRVVLTGISNIDQLGLGQLDHKDRFLPVGEVSPEVLEALLQRAAFLVYPTFNEGLGYPPIEAMSYGTPSVVSAVTAIPEVCESAVVYFDPYDLSSVISAIMDCITGLEKMSHNVLSRHYEEIRRKQGDDLEKLIALILGDFGSDRIVDKESVSEIDNVEMPFLSGGDRSSSMQI